MRQGTDTAAIADAAAGEDGMAVGDETLRIDGAQPISAELVARITEVCDRVERLGPGGRIVVRATGAPGPRWTRDLTVTGVNRWERALRRLERLPAASIGVADGDCGGAALDALLATDLRIATTTARLLLPVDADATWPGMALYRLVNQASSAAAVRRAILFGTPIGAAEALDLELVDFVTEEIPAALARARDLTGAVPGAELAIRRQLMADARTVGFEEALGVHLAACDRALRQSAAVAAS